MWHAATRDLERDIIPMRTGEGMELTPYRTLGSESFQTKAVFAEREKGHDGRKLIPISARDKRVSAALEDMAAENGCELVQVLLPYCILKTPHVFLLTGARKVCHLVGAIDGLRADLTAKEVARIEAAYPFDPGFPHTCISGTIYHGTDFEGTSGCTQRVRWSTRGRRPRSPPSDV